MQATGAGRWYSCFHTVISYHECTGTTRDNMTTQKKVDCPGWHSATGLVTGGCVQVAGFDHYEIPLQAAKSGKLHKQIL